MICIGGEKSWGRRIILGLGLIAACSAAALTADTITGVARNQTRDRLSADDEVILLRLDQAGLTQSMQEEARTRTDSQGSFALTVRVPDKVHLVRVIHQGVNYDQQASAGDHVSVDVFDAVAKVRGVTGNIEILRIGTSGNLLHVSDLIEIRNDSSPPLTQAGEHTFEVYLPARAKIDSVLAAGSGKIGVMISAAPVPREPGHYTVNFPLRPGATKFAFNYDLTYDGHTTFHTEGVYPLQQLVVMLPPTMRFTARSNAFQVLPTANDKYQVEVANQVKAGERPGFEISGMGVLPALQAQAQSPPKSKVAALPTPALSASGAQGQGVANALGVVPVVPASRTSVPLARLPWWILGAGAVLMLAACGFLLWRRQRRSADAMATAVQETHQRGQTSSSVVEALKGELFQLEIDRLRGTISGKEYDSAKQALEGTVKRALVRAGAKP